MYDFDPLVDDNKYREFMLQQAIKHINKKGTKKLKKIISNLKNIKIYIGNTHSITDDYYVQNFLISDKGLEISINTVIILSKQYEERSFTIRFNTIIYNNDKYNINDMVVYGKKYNITDKGDITKLLDQ